MLPIGLTAIGGAIGGACGGAAWAINRMIFQQTSNQVRRYVLTTMVSVSAVIVWLFLVGIFFSLFKKH
jgi:cell division protein FtsX